MSVSKKHGKGLFHAGKDMFDMLSEDLSDIEDLDSDENETVVDALSPRPVRTGADKISKNAQIEADELMEEEGEEEETNVHDEVESGNSGIFQDVPAISQGRTPPDWIYTEKNDIRWRRNPVVPIDLNVRPSFDNMSEVMHPELLPIRYFSNYITDSCIENMVEKTNVYAVQEGKTFKPTNSTEIRSFLGLHIMMGCLKYPRVRMYWDTALHIDLFVAAMSQDRFMQLRSNFHVVDNLDRPDNCNDRFYKVRPIFDSVRNRCLALTLESELCVDEQIVPFKGHLAMKQYCTGKPNPWGVKLYLLCGRSGICYDFILYQGGTPEIQKEMIKKFGLGASVVLKLSERIEGENYYLFFDNYFNTFNLLEILKMKKIYGGGIVKSSRFANVPFASDKDMMKKDRGYSEEVISMNKNVIMCKWYDNRPVVLASNFVGCGIQDEVQRWDKETKKYISIKRPEIVRRYNHAMGGADKLDMLISMYRIFLKSKKWPLRMLFHAIDMACVNGWLEYMRDATNLGEKKPLDLLHFKLRIGEALIRMGRLDKRIHGRPSDENQAKRPKTEIRPAPEIIKDLRDHFAEFDEKKEASRCKMYGCIMRTHIYCEKCKVHLCMVKGRNCFKLFHKK